MNVIGAKRELRVKRKLVLTSWIVVKRNEQ